MRSELRQLIAVARWNDDHARLAKREGKEKDYVRLKAQADMLWNKVQEMEEDEEIVIN